MVKITRNDNEAVVSPEGDMVAGKLGDLREQIHALAEQKVNINLNLKGVEVIDSTMVGMLISTQQLLRKHGCKLVLSNVPDEIVKMLKIMRLDRHFEVTAR